MAGATGVGEGVNEHSQEESERRIAGDDAHNIQATLACVLNSSVEEYEES